MTKIISFMQFFVFALGMHSAVGHASSKFNDCRIFEASPYGGYSIYVGDEPLPRYRYNYFPYAWAIRTLKSMREQGQCSILPAEMRPPCGTKENPHHNIEIFIGQKRIRTFRIVFRSLSFIKELQELGLCKGTVNLNSDS